MLQELGLGKNLTKQGLGFGVQLSTMVLPDLNLGLPYPPSSAAWRIRSPRVDKSKRTAKVAVGRRAYWTLKCTIKFSCTPRILSEDTSIVTQNPRRAQVSDSTKIALHPTFKPCDLNRPSSTILSPMKLFHALQGPRQCIYVFACHVKTLRALTHSSSHALRLRDYLPKTPKERGCS